MAKYTGTARKNHNVFHSDPSPLNIGILLPFFAVCVATYSTNYKTETTLMVGQREGLIAKEMRRYCIFCFV